MRVIRCALNQQLLDVVESPWSDESPSGTTIDAEHDTRQVIEAPRDLIVAWLMSVTCPKGLNPTKAINHIKELLVSAQSDDPHEREKLKWKCRRGAAELDIVLATLSGIAPG